MNSSILCWYPCISSLLLLQTILQRTSCIFIFAQSCQRFYEINSERRNWLDQRTHKHKVLIGIDEFLSKNNGPNLREPGKTPPQHWVPLSFCLPDRWKILSRCFHLDWFFCVIKHLFVCSLAVWMSASVKCTFPCYSPIFLTRLFFFTFLSLYLF